MEDILSKKECSIGKKTSIGGQALIEGIMMRGPKMTAMAVRNTDGEIVLEKWETQASAKGKFFKLPIVRGVFGFIDSMRFGYKCLMRSAQISGLDDLEEEAKREKEQKKAEKARKKALKKAGASEAEAVAEQAVEDSVASETEVIAEEAQMIENTEQTVQTAEVSADEKVEETTSENSEKSDKDGKKSSDALMNGIMVIAMVLGIALSVVLFMWLPSALYSWLSALIPILKPDNLFLTSLIKSVFEGVLKIVILVAYMALVSMMKDIRRTFQYHGAEHKTIFCYEHNKELTVENVRGERRFHPRCGTSFLILMLIVSIFISFFIDPVLEPLIGDVVPNETLYTLIRVAIKLLLLPIVMGLGYELIKLAGRHDNPFTRIISAPGVWLQHITVLEPTDDMIECAITAFKEVIPEDSSDNY